MAAPRPPTQIHKLPQYTYIDALRWLPHRSTFTRHILLATYDSDTSTPSLQTLTFSPNSQTTPTLTPQASIATPSRITSLKVSSSSSKRLIAAATFSGSVLFYSTDSVNGSFNLEYTVPEKGFHLGPVKGIDLNENGSECVSVGEDGRVNLVNLGDKEKGGFRRVFDSNGLVSYSSVKWASPMEFVTGGFGFGLHWWDQRKAGGPVALFKANWTGENASGIVHSIDIHPSRKHTCLAGGSSGTVFAWDIRSPKQPIILSGFGANDVHSNSLVESDIWEIQYDNYTHPSKINYSTSSRILPAMICSEDGVLGVIEQGEEPIELLAEPCAINSFDIDRQNPSDVICSLEWESLVILSRP